VGNEAGAHERCPNLIREELRIFARSSSVLARTRPWWPTSQRRES
jgi:hypothetical protein